MVAIIDLRLVSSRDSIAFARSERVRPPVRCLLQMPTRTLPGQRLIMETRDEVQVHVGDFLPTAAVVTQRLVSAHPELRSLAGRRMARVHAKVGIDCALRGEWRTALGHDLVAIDLAPLYWRAWTNLLLLAAPASIVRPVYEGLKRPWHALRQSRFSA